MERDDLFWGRRESRRSMTYKPCLLFRVSDYVSIWGTSWLCENGAIDHGMRFIARAEIALRMISDHTEDFVLGMKAVLRVSRDDEDLSRSERDPLIWGDAVPVTTDDNPDAV